EKRAIVTPDEGREASPDSAHVPARRSDDVGRSRLAPSVAARDRRRRRRDHGAERARDRGRGEASGGPDTRAMGTARRGGSASRRAVYRVGGASHHLSDARTVILNTKQPYELEFPETFGTQTLCVLYSDDLLRAAMTQLGEDEASDGLPEFPDVVFRPEDIIA